LHALSADLCTERFRKEVCFRSGRNCLEVVGCTALVLICVCWYFTREKYDSFPNPLFVMSVWETVAFFATLYATVISLAHICNHLRHNGAKRSLFVPTMRILLVVPLYANASFASILCQTSPRRWSVLITGVREVYEAIVLISFVQWVVEYWDGAVELAAKMSTVEVPHLFPLRCFLRRRAPGSDFVAFVLVGIIQYAVVMVAVLMLDFLLWAWLNGVSHAVHEEIWMLANSTVVAVLRPPLGGAWAVAASDWFYGVDPFEVPNLLKMASNGWAMYCLLLWYERLLDIEATRERMRSVHGVHKFLCIKFIVLITLWQELIMKTLVHEGIVSSHFFGPYEQWRPEDAANGMVNMAICLEMVMFAEWHRYAYSYREALPKDPDHGGGPGDRSYCCCAAMRKCRLGDITGFAKMYDDIFRLRRASWQQRSAVSVLSRHIKGRGVGMAQEEDLKEAFGKFDHNADGDVTVAQLKFLLMEGGITDEKGADELLLQANDMGRNGALSVDEFLTAVHRFCASGTETDAAAAPLLRSSRSKGAMDGWL